MTAADRPSVTDNARAEQRSEYTVEETAAYFARKVQRVSDRIRSTDYQRSVSDIVGLDSIQGFLDRVARDDLDMFAAGRAETTTATVEDALDAATDAVEAEIIGINAGSEHGARDVAEAAIEAYLLARAETATATTEDAARVIDDACYGGASSPQEIAQALADAGLLARPQPNWAAFAQAIYRVHHEHIEDNDLAVRLAEDATDAVLGLLRGGGGDR